MSAKKSVAQIARTGHRKLNCFIEYPFSFL
jgi:hypothetical protein